MNDNKACCAHCKVVLKHNDHPDGTRSDYWECADGCGTMFWPAQVFTQAIKDRSSALMRIKDLDKELEEIRAVFQHGADDEHWKPGTTLAQAVAGLKEKLRSSKT